MLYEFNHPYYPDRNKGIDLFVASIMLRRVKKSARRTLMSDRQGPSVVKETIDKSKIHHKLSLISLQEPWILQVFWVYSRYLKRSLSLLNA